VVTGARELEGVVGHGRGLCASSFVDLVCVLHWDGVHFGFGRIALKSTHGTSGDFGTKYFIVDNYYSRRQKRLLLSLECFSLDNTNIVSLW
jgi:hypothetical protein